jgi:hypothetical protein
MMEGAFWELPLRGAMLLWEIFIQNLALVGIAGMMLGLWLSFVWYRELNRVRAGVVVALELGGFLLLLWLLAQAPLAVG